MDMGQWGISPSDEWDRCLSIMADPSVSEITANGPDAYFLRRRGRLERVPGVASANEKNYVAGVRDGLAPLVDSLSPWDDQGSLFEGRLIYTYNGQEIQARCHVAMMPASDLPQVTIAKRSTSLSTIESIAEQGTMSTEMMDFLTTAVKANVTIAMSGGTGAGKALHVDTVIPTPSGFVRMGDIGPGNVVFDGVGHETMVVDVHRPAETAFFGVDTDDGESVRAGGGHLWTVVFPEDAGTYRSALVSQLTSRWGYLWMLASGPERTVRIGVLAECLHVGRRNVDDLGRLVAGFGDDNGEFSTLEVASYLQQVCRDMHDGLLGADGHHVLIPRAAVLDTASLARLVGDGVQVGVRRMVNVRPTDRGTVDVTVGDPGAVRMFAAIRPIPGVESDYRCLQVASPTHQFLCGTSGLATHNTTMLSALLKYVSPGFRIGVAEDLPELELIQPNVTYLHSVPWRPGMDSNRVVSLSWVVQQFQRMRTDKVIVGETRGKEFADFLVAANSGQEGSMTTIHANDPRACLDKMAIFALKGNPSEPYTAINTDISNAVRIIVQLTKLADGRHKMMSIEEVTHTLANDAKATISTQTLYKYVKDKDTFQKVSHPTDQLRELMILNGADVSRFLLRSKPGDLMPAHGTVDSVRTAPTPPAGTRPVGGGVPVRHGIPRH